MEDTAILIGMGAVAAALSREAVSTRLELCRAKHPSLTGHARMARRIAALIPYYAYDEERFFDSDGAPAGVVAGRRAGFARLAAIYRQRFARSAALTADADPNEGWPSSNALPAAMASQQTQSAPTMPAVAPPAAPAATGNALALAAAGLAALAMIIGPAVAARWLLARQVPSKAE